MVRGRLAVVVGLLASGVAWGNPTPGTIHGRVYYVGGPRDGQGMQGAEVYTLPQGHQGVTDDDGYYTITGVPAGSYEVWINTEYYCHVPKALHKPVTVAAGQSVQLDFPLPVYLLYPQIKFEPAIGGAPVCHTKKLQVRMIFEGFTIQPTWITIKALRCRGPKHEVTIFDAEVDEAWMLAHLVDTYEDDREVTYFVIDAEFRWDTTGCSNDPYSISMDVEFQSGLCGFVEPFVLQTFDSADVQNLVIHDVVTNAGNADFVLFDPVPGSTYNQPTVTFKIVDDGPEHGLFQWAVYLRDTRLAAWTDYATLTGTTTSPGEVTATFNQPGGPESGVLRDWGTYTVEILVREWGTDSLGQLVEIDHQWLKWPYYLGIPGTVPGTELKGHRMNMAVDEQDNIAVTADYYLTDTLGEEPTEVRAQLINPKLQTIADVSLPKTLNTFHQGVPIATISRSEFRLATHILVITAVDAHGGDCPPDDDHPENCPVPENVYQPRHYRDGENKLLLAVNERPQPAFLIKDVAWVPLHEGSDNNLRNNPANEIYDGDPGDQLGLRIFPCKFTSATDPLTDRNQVKVRVSIAPNGPDAADLDGQQVHLYLYDVDDPSRDPTHVMDTDHEAAQQWKPNAAPGTQAGNKDNNARGEDSPALPPGQAFVELSVVTCTNHGGDYWGESAPLAVSLQPGDNYRVVALPEQDAAVLADYLSALAAKPADPRMGVYLCSAAAPYT